MDVVEKGMEHHMILGSRNVIVKMVHEGETEGKETRHKVDK